MKTLKRTVVQLGKPIEQVVRVSDKEAPFKVEREGYHYVSKSVWRRFRVKKGGRR